MFKTRLKQTKEIITNIGTQFIYFIISCVDSKSRTILSRVEYFLKFTKREICKRCRRFDVKDSEIGHARGRPSKGGKGTLLKGSNTADDLC